MGAPTSRTLKFISRQIPWTSHRQGTPWVHPGISTHFAIDSYVYYLFSDHAQWWLHTPHSLSLFFSLIVLVDFLIFPSFSALAEGSSPFHTIVFVREKLTSSLYSGATCRHPTDRLLASMCSVLHRSPALYRVRRAVQTTLGALVASYLHVCGGLLLASPLTTLGALVASYLHVCRGLL